MARLKQVSDENAAPKAVELFDAIKARLGVVPNVYRVLANEPAALSAALGFNEALSAGSFDAETREAIALATAGANRCDYCASAHTAISKRLKVRDDEIERRLQGRSDDPKIQAVLAFATAVIDKRGWVTDADLKAARAAGLTDGEIVETVANAVANILTNYINHVAETDIDFPAVKTRAD